MFVRFPRLRLPVICISLLMFGVAQAEVIRFIHPGGGSLNDPANWEAEMLPGPSDTGIIDGAGNTSLSLTDDLDVFALNISNRDGEKQFDLGGYNLDAPVSVPFAPFSSTDFSVTIRDGALRGFDLNGARFGVFNASFLFEDLMFNNGPADFSILMDDTGAKNYDVDFNGSQLRNIGTTRFRVGDC